MRVVVALGGNALLRRGEPAEAATQLARVEAAASALAAIAREHELVVTHGNGPQVGLLALEADAYAVVGPYPLDILGAESQGMIGYLLTQALANALPTREVVAILTRVVVDRRDTAFRHPTKPIGPVYDVVEARRLAKERGWTIAGDDAGFRRVVASPEPRRIVELGAIARAVDAGAVVVCAGGGGVPVVTGAGGLEGVEAVIDKDLTATLLAEQLGAERLVMLTDVPCVERDWGTPRAAAIGRTSSSELRRLLFAAGSMAPKVEAACRFAESGGRVSIGALEQAAAVISGRAGTQVSNDSSGVARGRRTGSAAPSSPV